MVRGGREQGGSIRNRGWLGGRGAHEELGEEVGKGGGGRSACDGEGEARDGETMEEGGVCRRGRRWRNREGKLVEGKVVSMEGIAARRS